MSAPEYYEMALVTMPRTGPMSQRVEVVADFSQRVFIKTIRSENPLRVDENGQINSALDLVGRRVTWSTRTDDEELTRFAMRFGYAYGFGTRNSFLLTHEVDLTTGGVILAEHVGLPEGYP